MRKVLRSVCTFALAMLGAASVNAEVLLSANFDDGNTPFGGWGNDHTRTVVEGELVISNPSAVNPWEAQMAWDRSEGFLYDETYYIEFDVKGSAEGKMSAGFQVTDGYKGAGDFPQIDFTTEWSHYKGKVQVVLEGATRFLFSFGDFAGDIYMDNFQMYTQEKTSVSDAVDKTIADGQRWVNILTNSDLEGEDNISFVSVENDPEKVDETGAYIRGNAPILDGIGVDGSRGIKVKSFAGAAQDWDAQFWIEVPEILPVGTKYRVKFDYCASVDANADTQAHNTPSNYLHYDMIGSPAFTINWQTYEKEGSLSGDQAKDPGFKSIAFNLSKDKAQDVEFFFDNLYFYTYAPLTVGLHADEVIQLDFARKTNIADLVAAGGKSRLIFPNECATVTVNGESVDIYSVEAFADGRFYIFIDGFMSEGDDIDVTYNNPEDAAYQIVYTDVDGGEALQFAGKAFYNGTIVLEDVLPNDLAPAVILSSNPENNAFNLSGMITDFEVTFDKFVNLDVLKAELKQDGNTVEALTINGVNADNGYAEVVTLTRTGKSILVDGVYTIEIANIANESIIETQAFWGDASLIINIGTDPATFEQFEIWTDFIYMLNTAKTAMNNAADPLYEGVAYTAVSEVVAKYDAEYMGYTNPSQFEAAIAVLKVAANDMNKHKDLCDNYYNAVNGAVDALANYSTSKFAGLPLYIDLQAATAKYLNEEGAAIKLIDDAELQAAIDAISPAVSAAGQLFTEGSSDVGTTGVAALIERIRLGANALLSLGASETDELIVKANNALEDDDALADEIKMNLKKELYNQLQNPENTLFEGVMDETTLEMVPAKYDMTVFVKNPNIYRQGSEVPGWATPEGYSNPGTTDGWSVINYEIVDNMFQTWKSGYCTEQTIEDLPAGVYTIVVGVGERDNEEGLVDSYIYAKTSATLEGEFADSTHLTTVIGQTFPHAENGGVAIEGITVTDGKLTIGYNAGGKSCTFLNDVRLYINGAAAGFDYATAYKEVVDGIILNEAPAQVVGVELYDLNGRRLMKAQKGIVIVKKIMSDGTINVAKEVK